MRHWVEKWQTGYLPVSPICSITSCRFDCIYDRKSLRIINRIPVLKGVKPYIREFLQGAFQGLIIVWLLFLLLNFICRYGTGTAIVLRTIDQESIF